ncbi:MAG: mannosyltransferase family protein [Candidatus Limnocylindrus sp.]
MRLPWLDGQRKTIVTIWALWAMIVISFQAISYERVRLVRPDYAVSWSSWETELGNNLFKDYLNEDFLNQQVAWDSEYYLGIAVGGYDDPIAGTATDPKTNLEIPRNYSFFPFYPALIRVVAAPLSLIGLNAIATATLAGLIITLLGTLAGLFALDDLIRRRFKKGERSGEEATGLSTRAATYLLIFPGALFFAQIYTEGLFIGLAFGSIALALRQQWLLAGALATAAALTRAHGVLTAIPLAIIWWNAGGAAAFSSAVRDMRPRRIAPIFFAALPLVAIGLPIVAHLIWRTSALGEGWARLQDFYFGRGYLSITDSAAAWVTGAAYAFEQGREALVTYALDRISLIMAIVASLALLRQRQVEIATFSLALIATSGLSGDHQSTIRYMAIVPALPIWLAGLGRRPWFDRAWSLGSALILALLLMLFSRDFWVA